MASPTSPSGVLPALRAATGEAHQRLEDVVAIERCLGDLARYRRLLEVFLGFYRPLEDHLATASGWQDHPERRKTPWLVADLCALGLSAPKIDALPECPDLPRVNGLGSVWGCFYVLEGATLGGRHISAMMVNSVVPSSARRFFAGYGERTGERWREFIVSLEEFWAGSGTAEQGKIIHGASETFACLNRWYVRQCPTDELPG